MTANYGYYEDQAEVDLYNKMLRETDFAKQRALMREFEKYVVDDQAHEIWVVWWYRIIPHRVLCEGLEDQPEPFPQSGSGDGVARQITKR